jgi:hypothetical protein
MTYSTMRPGVVGFSCTAEAEHYGETPLFDCGAIFESLPPALRERLCGTPMRFKRRFSPADTPWDTGANANEDPGETTRGGTGGSSARVGGACWKRSFNMQEPGEVTAYCDQVGMSWEWEHGEVGGTLLTSLDLPTAIVHPTTGRACIQLQMPLLGPLVYSAMTDMFPGRFGKNEIDAAVARGAAAPPCSLGFSDGSALSEEEVTQWFAAVWRHAVLFMWQEGDVCVVDNVGCAHARMNLDARVGAVKTRQLVTCIGDMHDARGMVACSAAASAAPPPPKNKRAFL